MAHTFLFEPAVWTTSGTLWRADGEALEAIGRTEIAHRPQCWLLSGTLKVLGSPRRSSCTRTGSSRPAPTAPA